jgi:translocator protein
MKNARSLLVFVLLVAAAAAFGGSFQPGAWYAGLRKPPLTPPGWVFGPAWSILYLCIAVAGWIVWTTQRRVGLPLLLWGAQLALNAMWSYLFFGMQRPGTALLEIAVLLIVILATTDAFFRVRRTAGLLFVPYALWVCFAVYLNAGLWLLNRGA